MARGFTSAEGRLMRKHTLFNVFLPTSLLVFGALMAADARSAELEGALQYPPASVGEDAQPPPPARMLPQSMAPRRIELGFSGSSVPPSGQRLYIRPPIGSQDRPPAQPQSGSGR
jgi:hypothetical protein